MTREAAVLAGLAAELARPSVPWVYEPKVPQGPCSRWQWLDLDECTLHGGAWSDCVEMGRA